MNSRSDNLFSDKGKNVEEFFPRGHVKDTDNKPQAKYKRRVIFVLLLCCLVALGVSAAVLFVFAKPRSNFSMYEYIHKLSKIFIINILKSCHFVDFGLVIEQV